MSNAVAYIRRDFLVWSSYRLAAFWQFLAIIVLVGVIYLAAKVVGDQSNLIDEQHGSYVAYILISLAFLDVLLQGFGMPSRGIAENQRAGTLEPMLLAPISNLSLLMGFWYFRLILSLFRMSISIGFGLLILGFWHSANPLTVLLILVPAQLTYFGLGAASAAFTVLVKEGDPIRLGYTTLTAILGGAFFPIDALPDFMKALSYLVPLSYALDGIRRGMDGAGPAEVWPQVVALTVMSAVLVPIGIWAFSWSVRRAKREGALGEY